MNDNINGGPSPDTIVRRGMGGEGTKPKDPDPSIYILYFHNITV